VWQTNVIEIHCFSTSRWTTNYEGDADYKHQDSSNSVATLYGDALIAVSHIYCAQADLIVVNHTVHKQI
jgi:hypothetical protein